MQSMKFIAFFMVFYMTGNWSSANTTVASTLRPPTLAATMACIDNGFGYSNNLVAMDYFALTVLGFYAILVIIERTLVYLSAKNNSRVYSKRVALALSVHDTAAAINLSKNCYSNPLPKAFTEVLNTKQAALQNDFDAENFQITAIGYARAECETEMKKNLIGLKQASYIALILGGIGTCIGILDAIKLLGFTYPSDDYDDSFSAFTWQLSQSFNLFLFSLIIAIPCLWFYKQFSKKAEGLLEDLETDSRQLIHLLIDQPAKKNKRNKKIQDAILSGDYQSDSVIKSNLVGDPQGQ